MSEKIKISSRMRCRLYAFPKTGGGYNLEYYLKDHLFSNRIVFSDVNVNGSINAASEILQEETDYPFGLQQSGFNTSIAGINNNIYKIPSFLSITAIFFIK